MNETKKVEPMPVAEPFLAQIGRNLDMLHKRLNSIREDIVNLTIRTGIGIEGELLPRTEGIKCVENEGQIGTIESGLINLDDQIREVEALISNLSRLA